MDLGEKLYRLRKSKGLTQAQLGQMVGVTEAAIRSYESGKRNPKEKHLERIAKALDIRKEAVADYGASTLNEVVQSLFRLDDGHYGLHPVLVGDRVYLEFDDPALKEAMADWLEKRDAHEVGALTDEEYASWQDRYYVGTLVDLDDGEVVGG